MNDRLGEDMG